MDGGILPPPLFLPRSHAFSLRRLCLFWRFGVLLSLHFSSSLFPFMLRNPVTDNIMPLSYLLDGEATFQAFSVTSTRRRQLDLQFSDIE